MTAVAPSEKRRKGNKGGAGAAAAGGVGEVGGGGGGGIGSAQAHTREDPHHTWNAQLMEACLACDVDAVKRLIDRGADPVAAREVPPLSFYTGPIVDQVRQQHQQMQQQQQQFGATGNANPSAGGGAPAADGSAAGSAPLIDFDAPRGEVPLQQQRSGGGDAAPGGTAPTPAAVAAASAGVGAATASAMASLAAAASPDALPPLAVMLLSGLNTPEALEVMRVLVEHGASVNDTFRYTTVTAAAAAAGTVNTGGGAGGGLGGGLDGAGDGGAGTVGGAAAGAGATSAGGGQESGASSNANSGRGKASRAPSAELKGRQSTIKSKVFATTPAGGVMGGIGAGGSLATGTVGAAAIQVLEAPKHEENFVTGSVLHYVVAHGDHAQLMRLLLTATAIQPSVEEAAVSSLQTPMAMAIAAPSILAATASGAGGEHSGAEAWAPPMPPLPLPYTLLAAVEAETVVGVLRQQHRHRLVTGGEGTAAGGGAAGAGGGPNASGAAPPSRKSRGVSNAAAAVAAAAAAAAAATPAAPLPVTGPVPPAALVCSISADAVLAALQHLLRQRRTHGGGYFGLPLLLSVYPQQRDPDAAAAPPHGNGKDRPAPILGGGAAKSAAGAEKSARASASVVAAPCRWWSLPELCGALPAGRRSGGAGVVDGNLSATTAPSGDAAVARRTVLEFDLLDSCGRTAATVALDRGDALSVRLLDFWGAHVPFDALVNACETRLARACALGDVARVEALLRQGDSLTQISSDGRYTLVHYAAAQPAVLRVLAEHGLSVEFENALGESAVASLLRHGTGRNDPRYVQTLASVATAARSGVAESAPNSAAANVLNSLSSSAVANAVRFAHLPAAVQRNLILCPAPGLAALGGANLLAGTAAGSTYPRSVSVSGSATGAGAAASGAAAAGPAVAAASHPAQPSQPFFGGRELGTWWSFLPPAASTADVLDTLLRAGALMQGFIPDEELDLPYVQFAEQQVRIKSPPPSHSTKASLKGGGGGGGGRRRLGDRGHGSFWGRSPRGRGGDEPYFDVDDLEDTVTEPGDDGDDDFADEEDDVGDEQQSGDLGDSSSTIGTVLAEKFRSSRTLAATASPGGRVGRGRRSRGTGSHAAAAARLAPLPARLPLRMTPLQHAIFDYHPELIRRLLVDYRVDPMQRDSQGATAVHYAALCSHAPSVLEILFAPQVLNPTGAPLAGSTAAGGLKGRAGSNSGAGDGHAVSSAAAAAAAPTSATAASGLGGGGAGLVTEIHMDINAVDMAGRTPLFYAALVGNATAVQRLMRFGGATLLCGKADMDGYTPLHIAVRQRHAEIVEQLIRHSNQLISNAANGGRGPSADVFAELLASTGGAGGSTAASPARSSRAGAVSGRRGSHRSGSGLALGAGGASSGANDVLLNPELLVNVEAEERVTRMTPLEMAIKLQREHQEHLATITERAQRDADERGSAALVASDSLYAISGPDPSAAAAAAAASSAVDKDALLRIVSVLLSEAQASPLRPSGLPNGGALLHRAVADGSVEMAELLLTHYADPNETDDADETPLFLALRLQATAAPATPGASTAAAAASPPLLSSSSASAAAEAHREHHRRRRTALVRVLLQHGAKPYAQSGVHLQTPLHLAAGSLGDADELIRLLFYSLPELPSGGAGVAGRRRRLDGAGAGAGAMLADGGNASQSPYGSGATGGGVAGAGLGARKRHSSFGSMSGRQSSLERRLRDRRGQKEQRRVSPTSIRGSHAAGAAVGGASVRRKPWATSASAGGGGESSNANERSTSLLDGDGADAGGGGGAGLDEQGSLANSSFGNRDTRNSSFASQETFSPEHSATRGAGGAAAAAAAMDSEYADEHQRLLLRLAQWQTPDHLLAPEQCWLLTDAQGRTPLHILCSRTPRALQRMPAVLVLLDDLQAVTRAAAVMASVVGFASDAAAGPGGAGGEDDHLLSLSWRIPDAQGRTPLHAAAQSGFVEAVERVLQQAPRTALAVDVDGRTVLHACALMAASPARETSADLVAPVSASLQAPASPTRAVVHGGGGENPSAEESPEEARRAAAAAEAAAEQAARLRGILALLQQAVNAGNGDIPAAMTGLQLHGLPIRRAATDVLPSLSIKTSGAWSSGSEAVGAAGAAGVPGLAASPPPTAATRRAVMSLVQNSSITTQLQRWQQSRHWGCPGMAAHAVSSSSVSAGLAHISAAQRASPASMPVWRAYAQLPDAQGRTALLLAAEVGNVGAARELLRTMQSS